MNITLLHMNSCQLSAHDTCIAARTAMPAACVVVSVCGQLAGDALSKQAKQLMLHELVATLNLVFFRARLLTASFLMWTHG